MGSTDIKVVTVGEYVKGLKVGLAYEEDLDRRFTDDDDRMGRARAQFEVEQWFLHAVMRASSESHPLMLGLMKYDLVGTEEALYMANRAVRSGSLDRVWDWEVNGNALDDGAFFGPDAPASLYLVARGSVRLMVPFGSGGPFHAENGSITGRFGFKVDEGSVIRFPRGA